MDRESVFPETSSRVRLGSHKKCIGERVDLRTCGEASKRLLGSVQYWERQGSSGARQAGSGESYRWQR